MSNYPALVVNKEKKEYFYTNIEIAEKKKKCFCLLNISGTSKIVIIITMIVRYFPSKNRA